MAQAGILLEHLSSICPLSSDDYSRTGPSAAYVRDGLPAVARITQAVDKDDGRRVLGRRHDREELQRCCSHRRIRKRQWYDTSAVCEETTEDDDAGEERSASKRKRHAGGHAQS
jgi:hypothetical protein